MQDSRKSNTKSTYRGHSVNLLFKANLVDLLASLARSTTQKGDENQVSIKNHRMQRATCIDEQIEVGLQFLLETRFDPYFPAGRFGQEEKLGKSLQLMAVYGRNQPPINARFDQSLRLLLGIGDTRSPQPWAGLGNRGAARFQESIAGC